MSETSFRVANFLKLFSMLMVLAGLIYFYGYSEGQTSFLNSGDHWIVTMPKAYIFYSGLLIFALVNVLLNVAISIHKGAAGVNSNSLFHKSEKQKDKVNIGLTYLLTAANVMISMSALYIAFLRINGQKGNFDHVQFPIFGMVVLVAAVGNLVMALRSK